MISGTVVGIVLDNRDPDQRHRVLVKYPVDSGEELKSSWCRMITPMAGGLRGLTILPDIGTEVVLGFAYRSMVPYILGAVYNGTEDKAEPFRNMAGKNNLRVFWSRNNHMVIFDDTPGEEKVELGANAPARLNVSSGPIHQTLDSAQRTITTYSDGNIEWDASSTISIKCTDFHLDASNSIDIRAGSTVAAKAGGAAKMSAGGDCSLKGSNILANCGVSASPMPAISLPSYRHPPKR